MKLKHILMLKTFIKVMLGSKSEISAITPDSYYPNIYEIDYSKLKENNYSILLFDIDNTIAKVDDLNVPQKTIELFDRLKKLNFKILLISNNHQERVIPISKKLDVPALSEAKKPEKKPYEQALKQLNSKKENAVAIGDQLLSDIIGAKKNGIKAILVDQLSNENNIKTGMAQKLQKHIIKKLTKENKFRYKKYY